MKYINQIACSINYRIEMLNQQPFEKLYFVVRIIYLLNHAIKLIAFALMFFILVQYSCGYTQKSWLLNARTILSAFAVLYLKTTSIIHTPTVYRPMNPSLHIPEAHIDITCLRIIHIGCKKFINNVSVVWIFGVILYEFDEYLNGGIYISW